MFSKGKTRCVLVVLLVAVFLARFFQWRGEKAEVEGFCSKYIKTNSKFNRELVFEGEPFYEVGEEGLTIRLYHPTWGRGGSKGRLSTEVIVRGLSVDRAAFGRRVRLSGPLKCERKLRNPGRLEDGELSFFIPKIRLSAARTQVEVLPGPLGFDALAFQWTRQFIDRRFQKYPGLHALVTSVWTGRGDGLPENLLNLYRDLGLLPVLALSGQHVLILSGLATIFLVAIAWIFFHTRFRAPVGWVGRAREWIPLLSTMVLYFTSAGVPSMRRTTGMVAAIFVLRARGIYSSKIQTCLSTLGLMLLWNPDEMLSVGFLLSGIFTAFTIVLSFDFGVRRFFCSSLALPALGFPVTAFFFARIAWLTIPAQLTLGLVWELGWIPLAFLLPLVEPVLPGPVLSKLEAVWSWFVAMQLDWLSGLSQSAMLVVRPTWLELGLVEALLLFAVLRWVASRRE